MKNILSSRLRVLLLAVIIIGVGSVLSLNQNTAQPVNGIHFLFDKNLLPVPQVKNIFDHLGAPIANLQEANQFAQKNLLRTGERWDDQKENIWHLSMAKNQTLLLRDFNNLNMINEIKPAKNFYDYILMMGSLKKNTLSRLDYLKTLMHNGLTFNELVLLGGERALRDEEKEGLPSDVTNEAQMMAYVCSQDPVFKNTKILLINAPMVKKADGTMTRPTTDDTLVHFAKVAQAKGSCLVVSNNPYILRQTKVAQRILNQTDFPTDGAGRKASEDTIDIVMLMDEFARTIYEEFKVSQAR